MELVRTFAVVLDPEEEGGFTVRVPALPEIVTYGSDEREALAMAQDAIRLVVSDMRARRADSHKRAAADSRSDRHAGRMNIIAQAGFSLTEFLDLL